MAKYNEEELKRFADAIKEAGSAIGSVNPAFYMVSLNGGLPLFDVLGIVDRNVDYKKAIYFPGSSRIKDSARVLTNCFANRILEKKDQSAEIRPIVALDEVVSGGSVERIINSYNAACRGIARGSFGASQNQRTHVEDEARHLMAHFPLYSFGIKEVRERGTLMNPEYLKRVASKEVLEFPVPKIITMDDSDYQTVEFDKPQSSGFRQGFFPRVKRLVCTAKYMDLLRDVAGYVGANPDEIHIERARVISDCERYSKKPSKEDFR